MDASGVTSLEEGPASALWLRGLSCSTEHELFTECDTRDGISGSGYTNLDNLGIFKWDHADTDYCARNLTDYDD